MQISLDKAAIEVLMQLLNDKLSNNKATGELYMVGGAVMSLVFGARAATKDIDAQFQPKALMQRLVQEIAVERELDAKWLNDAVKGFFGAQPDFKLFRDYGSLRLFIPQPEYLLAMKCLAMRLGPEFFDEADVRFLLRYLNVTAYEEALRIIGAYYPIERFPQKTLYALQEILAK